MSSGNSVKRLSGKSIRNEFCVEFSLGFWLVIVFNNVLQLAQKDSTILIAMFAVYLKLYAYHLL